MRRHSWQPVRTGKHCCRHCGMVRLSVPYRNFHRLQYERCGQFWEKAPPCDGAWPPG